MTAPTYSGGFGTAALFGNSTGSSNLSHSLTIPTHDPGDLLIMIAGGATQDSLGSASGANVRSGYPVGTLANTGITIPGFTTICDVISSVNGRSGTRSRLKVAYRVGDGSVSSVTVTGDDGGGTSAWNNSTGTNLAGFRARCLPKVINYGSFSGAPVVSYGTIHTNPTTQSFNPTPNSPPTSPVLAVGVWVAPSNSGEIGTNPDVFLNSSPFPGETALVSRAAYKNNSGTYTPPTLANRQDDAMIAVFFSLSSSAHIQQAIIT